MVVAVFFIVALLLVAFGGYMAAIEAALGITGGDLRDQNAVGFVRITSETTAAVLVTLAFVIVFDHWWLALIVSAAIMTGASFVLVGTSPRSVGREHPVGLLRSAGPLIRVLRAVLGPLAGALVALGDRVTPKRARSAVGSEEQLLNLIDDAAEHDVLEEQDAELIHSVFEFTDTVVREVMVPRTDMVTIDADATVAAAMSVFLGRGVSRVPVVEGDVDDATGVIYLRDVARLVYERPAEADDTIVRTLQKPAIFVPESKNAAELLRQMQRESNHLALIVDEYGGIAGLVTLEDLIEELVGDISDEYDKDAPLVEELEGEPGAYRVAARLATDELGELFGLELDDEDVDSVGGLLAKALGKIPEVGDAARVGGVELTAERTEGRRGRLSTVLVRRATMDDDE
ncbi:hemolysin family protein [Gryllotalpicola ginsengisoli]|uniref:hemolysin family protein n=1 Tax=Gryllotalpicola ginsengisoli TaxID=444608 RepID=UPI0003B761CC|nr:hemolysin family protein [Gryllotalpicola ginsengisoli]